MAQAIAAPCEPEAGAQVLAVEAHTRYLASFARVWEEDEKEQEARGSADRAAGAADRAPSAPPFPPPPAAPPPPLPPPAPLEHVATEHFWLSGLYWGLTALDLLGRLDSLDTDKAWRWVQRCFKPVGGEQGGGGTAAAAGAASVVGGGVGGGYGGSPRHDAHLLPTTSAVQVAALLGRLSEVDAEAVEEYVTSLQLPDGSFAGDRWGEVDTRFSYCALLTLSLLWRGRVPAPGAVSGAGDDDGDAERRRRQRQSRRALVGRCARHVLRCRNFDGGFGAQPGGESHAGQVFTCVGVLALARRLGWRWWVGEEEGESGGCGGWAGEGEDDEEDDEEADEEARGKRRDRDGASDRDRRPLLPGADLLAWWLCERQTPSGGLNGRPEKLQDVCYSWWCAASLALLGRLAWVDRGALAAFVLSCQDTGRGGISDRPDDAADVYHTFFGLAGLGLLRWPGVVDEVDPAFALPRRVVERELRV